MVGRLVCNGMYAIFLSTHFKFIALHDGHKTCRYHDHHIRRRKSTLNLKICLRAFCSIRLMNMLFYAADHVSFILVDSRLRTTKLLVPHSSRSLSLCIRYLAVPEVISHPVAPSSAPLRPSSRSQCKAVLSRLHKLPIARSMLSWR